MHRRAEGIGEKPSETIRLRIRSSCDWTYAIICVLGVILCLWEAIWGFVGITPQDLSGIRFESSAEWLLGEIGPNSFRIIAAFMAAITGAIGIGALWRLFDPRFSMVATPAILAFHPSICARPLAWSEIEDIMITRGRPTKLSVKLLHRSVSLYMPLTSRFVQIPIMVSGWTYRETENNVSQMRRWRREARS